MLKRHLPNILTYFTHRITNAGSEAINSVVQMLKKRAFGYRSFGFGLEDLHLTVLTDEGLRSRVMRGRLINPFLAEIAQLDTVATAADPDAAGPAVSGYDPDFKETLVLGTPGGERVDARKEKVPIRVPCQVQVRLT
jgi:hypothetical protein